MPIAKSQLRNFTECSMTTSLKPTKTVFTASQFLEWQRTKRLVLSPIFQRRPVWKPAARSQLVDSIVKGYPIPIILLRQVQDLETLETRMEVVDGQQRLRTIIAYLDAGAIADFKDEDDAVVISRAHNPAIAGRPFAKLDNDTKQQILSYEFSTHILPASTGDELVFRIFARLNSTGLSLNKQEIRNSEFHGAFKSLVYDLSFRSLDRWRTWGVFSNDNISRMDEAEAVSEYLMTMVNGLEGKSQAKITNFYRQFDDDLPAASAMSDRFEKLMTQIGEGVGGILPTSVFRRPALFFSLFVATYDHCYGLKSPLKKTAIKPLPAALQTSLRKASERISQGELPDEVRDAMNKGTSDPKRRRVRHRFLMQQLKLVSAGA